MLALNERLYDTIVIGAGIAGISTAWWLKKSGQKVLLLDKKGPLAGASGAAGAFLSPRLGRGGDLQKITNEAYRFALRFYAKRVPEGFFQKGLVRIPKDEKDAEKFASFEPFIDVPFEKVTASDFPHIAPEAMRFGAFFFKDAAFVDPMTVAMRLMEGIKTRWGFDAKPVYRKGAWHIGQFSAENIVLATGADRLPVKIPYIEIGGVWGERVDVRSDAEIPVTLHRKLSVSANVEGIVRIGATHVRNDSRSEIERVNQLIVDAVGLVPSLQDQQIVRIYAGHRSSVSDHFPLAGAAADAETALARLGKPSKSLKPEDGSIPRIGGLFLIGGFGGRGFVFGPMMGKMVAEKIIQNSPVDIRVSPDRYLLRFLRHH
ncbi:NAD(P)/FAD-dependent oxidoreductase [Hydrogenimonas urashimensis]|uniref:NAD(P)/FAD-dependent oxidoreductase n=1 Tax=Hydrogenimonas urashimensis TaxID=2740515 RepID=UPI001916AAB3|nr:FAD-dependent oxidoreductase [Hydrogenimonas urashimensis]